MTKRDLKRFLTCGLAALTLLLPLAGCGEQAAEPDPTPSVHEPVEEPPEATPDETAPPEPTATPEPTPEETAPPPAATEKPVTLLDALYGAGEFNAPRPVSYGVMDPTLSQTDRILQIRAWYQETEGNSPQYEKRAYDDSFTAYWTGGVLAKIEVTEQIDPAVPDGTKYYYYYRDGNPYFIYVEDSAHQLRLYYWNAQMIRWIESDHVEHDSDNPAYAQYYATSWRLYQIVTALG